MALKAVYDAAAPAKLNLFLHIVGRRDDGYHLLQSVFTLVDWADTLNFELRGDARIARHDLGMPLPQNDLCVRAARALQQEAGVNLGVDISIDKQLPSGAGMGGGSSDAATTLLVLNRLWGVNWPRERIMTLALGLGADVPFFVGGRNAWVEGIGERSTALDLPEMTFAVVKPQASIETATLFCSPLVRRNAGAVRISGFAVGEETRQFSEGFGRNDLQDAAVSQCADVGIALRWLEERFGNSRMTGSGSAVFARTDGPSVRLPDLPAGWTGRCCRSLRHHPLVGWSDGRR